MLFIFFTDTQPSGGFSDSQGKEIFEGILSLTNLRAFYCSSIHTLPLRVNVSAVLRTIIIQKKVGIFSLCKNLLWRFLQQISVSYKNGQKKTKLFYSSLEIPQENIFELQKCVKNYFTYYWHYCMALTFMRGSFKCLYLLHGESVEILTWKGGGGS